MLRKPGTETKGDLEESLPLLRAVVWAGMVEKVTTPLPFPLSQEIFGPVLTVYVYPDEKYRETLQLVDSTTSYGLTGAVFAQDK